MDENEIESGYCEVHDLDAPIIDGRLACRGCEEEDAWIEREVERRKGRQHSYVSSDSDPVYRSSMKDAGRGNLLR